VVWQQSFVFLLGNVRDATKIVVGAWGIFFIIILWDIWRINSPKLKADRYPIR
jgi:hypothetical protein